MSVESVRVPGTAPADEGRVHGEEIRPGGGRIVFPRDMEERFRRALAVVYDEMYASDDVIALLCFGSAQRGDAKPGSDLDLRAVTHGKQRWMESRVVEGVEVQLKVGSLRGWRGMMQQQNASLIRSFATGELVFDKTGEATELKRLAEERFRAGPRPLEPAAVNGLRYGLTNMIRDLEEMPGDSLDARMLSGVAVVESSRSWCMFQSIWESGKITMMVQNLRARDPLLTEKIERFYASPSSALAIAVVDAVLEPMGGRLYQIAMPREPA